MYMFTSIIYIMANAFVVCRIDIDSRQLEISVTSAMIREKLDELQIHGPPKTEVDCTFVLNARTEQKVCIKHFH